MPEEHSPDARRESRLDADAFEREVTTDLDEGTPDKPKGLALHTRILIGLAVGVVAGVVVNRVLGPDNVWVVRIIDHVTNPVGQLFLRLLLMIVVPLVFSSLVVGVAGIGDIRKLGRVGLKSFGYCLVVSAISVVIGLTLANTIKPGTRIDPATKAALELRYASDATKQVEAVKKAGVVPSPLMQVVETLVPANPFAAMAGVPANPSTATSGGSPNMLHLMFFALILGIAVTLIPVRVTAPFLRGLEALYEITAKIIEMIMKRAANSPVGCSRGLNSPDARPAFAAIDCGAISPSTGFRAGMPATKSTQYAAAANRKFAKGPASSTRISALVL